MTNPSEDHDHALSQMPDDVDILDFEVASPPSVATARERLRAAAERRGALDMADIEALLAEHILDTDARARDLGKTCSDLVAFLFSDQKPDPTATLSLLSDLSSLSRASAEEMRRTIELLARIRRRPPPRVQVVAVDGRVNVAGQQVNAGAIDLGERR